MQVGINHLDQLGFIGITLEQVDQQLSKGVVDFDLLMEIVLQ